MSARSLRLVAPFRCQFNLNSAKMLEEGNDFNGFLHSLNTDFSSARARLFPGVPQGVVVEALLRPKESDTESRYISLDKISTLFNSPKYLSISFDETLLPHIVESMEDAAGKADKSCGKPLSNIVTPIIDSLDIAVYDNTIAILTVDVALNDQFDGDDWAVLDEWTTRLIFFFLRHVYPDYICPTLCDINRYAESKKEERIRNPLDYFVFHDLSGHDSNPTLPRLLWVNRTLICPKGKATHHWATRHMDASQAIHGNNAYAHLSVGNNVIETTEANSPSDFSFVWEGMYLAQYYYAVLDIAGKNLKRFIGANYDKKPNRELRELSRVMDAVINSITILQVEYQDTSTELQGLPKTVFRRLEKEWDIPALIKNVQSKYDLCKAHGQSLNAHISQRNSVRVEMVLTGVAGVGLIGLMMNLSSYGRALMREGYKNDVIGLLDIGQHLSPSVMVWIGIFLAIGISAFVTINRTR